MISNIQSQISSFSNTSGTCFWFDNFQIKPWFFSLKKKAWLPHQPARLALVTPNHFFDLVTLSAPKPSIYMTRDIHGIYIKQIYMYNKNTEIHIYKYRYVYINHCIYIYIYIYTYIQNCIYSTYYHIVILINTARKGNMEWFM